MSLGVVAVMMGARGRDHPEDPRGIDRRGRRDHHQAGWPTWLPTGSACSATFPRGLPAFGLPAFGLHNTLALLGTSASIFLVILAQSAATSRAYAAKYGEPFSTDTDLVGLWGLEYRRRSSPGPSW